MLKCSELFANYGSVAALKGISIEVQSGEIVAVIGSNGAGKTTLINSILGFVKPHKGTVIFEGQDITNIPAHKTTNLGISVVPEAREVFYSLTVKENLRMGLKKEIGKVKQQELEDRLVHLFDTFPRLKERINQQAGTLSGGEQQMLVISRALISNPKLLLLDEPSLGLAPIIVNEIFEIIKTLKKEGITIVLVEQIANKALSVADKAYVIENGKIVMSGSASELKENKDIAKAYLGV
ncbi:ABC transporter ATP-binding protein [Peribacillus cavernae]|uniref:ABC transporter ATP-binding protein n=1 Tax=Peribacillus cavernae TaxID=1674310 RepID=A0A433HJC8_9BACI|nr:ABC transporter ATP-binding protein [Peribacillus cavernae]MDQ0217727.1 branched-chain amino acid transport system ATP-binding protein [Peribacillus cavernae]RUQ28192.1 ABC transporter ATP-binding protein [Peribacillus cavernae]